MANERKEHARRVALHEAGGFRDWAMHDCLICYPKLCVLRRDPAEDDAEPSTPTREG